MPINFRLPNLLSERLKKTDIGTVMLQNEFIITSTQNKKSQTQNAFKWQLNSYLYLYNNNCKIFGITIYRNGLVRAGTGVGNNKTNRFNAEFVSNW